MKKVWLGLFATLAIAIQANAAPIVISNITGGWQSATPAANATIQNGANQSVDSVRWGGLALSDDSGYDFDPTNNPVGFTLGTPFALGVFTHINKPIPDGTSITGIDYSLSFDTNGSPNSLSDVFHFAHNETPNSNPCPTPSTTPCDDIVTISSVNLNSLITVGTDQYFFNLLGFSTNGGTTISTQFLSPEGGSNSATLYGTLTSQPIRTPEASSLVLLGSGLILLAAMLRTRHSSDSGI